MKWGIQDSISVHRLNEGASWFVNASLAIISFRKDLYKSWFVMWTNILELGPPSIGIFKELLKNIWVILPFKFKLFFYLILAAEFTFHHWGIQIEIDIQDTKCAFMGQIDGFKFSCHLNWIWKQHMAPIKILRTQDYRLLVFSVPQNSQMNRDVELDHFAGVKFDISCLSFKLKNEGFIEFKFASSSDLFSVVPISHETNGETYILIVSGIDKIYKRPTINNLALNMPFVWIKLFHSAGSWRLTCSATALETIRLGNIRSSTSGKGITSALVGCAPIRNLNVV